MARVLIVDDNADNLNWLAQTLKRNGYDVALAAGGKEGVQQAGDASPDLILMDMTMPEMDGWEATIAIREQGLTVPVIALTGHAMAGDRERALAAGCTEYLTKPVAAEKLLALIETLISTVDNEPVQN